MLESGAMSTRAVPDAPEYRITLFYGPETSVEAPHDSHCVFNVKKRSWKGGIQVEVRLSETQLKDLTESLRFDLWLDEALGAVPADDSESFRARARDLLVQQLCAVKLELAIAEGIAQQNTVLDGSRFRVELASAVPPRRDSILGDVSSELDLPRQ